MSIVKRIIVKLLNEMPFRTKLLPLLKFWRRIDDDLFPLIRYIGEFEVFVDGGKFKLLSTGSESLENELFWRGVEGIKERSSLNIWVELAKISNTILDVGANTGLYGLAAFSVNNRSSVYCFEPQNIAFDKLKKNIEINGFDGVKAEKIAVSNKNGKSIFFDVEEAHFYSASLNNKAIPKSMKQITYEVNAICLDKFIKEKKCGNVDLIKIDAELHEFEVLMGMQEILKASMPTILIEVINEEMAEILRPLFIDTEYLIFNLEDTPRLISQIEKAYAWNLLICRENIAKHLGLID